MRIVNVRANPGIYFQSDEDSSLRAAEKRLEARTFNSAPVNIGRELVRTGQISSYTEWRFWKYPTNTYLLNGIPVNIFQSADEHDLTELERHISSHGEPHVIWAEGIHLPHTLRRIFNLCPNSVKIIYPKYSEPWLIEGLEYYDACLVDERWQVKEMQQRRPNTRCRVWDKLVDYEQQFYPLHTAKKFDICYVARLHPRKYHKLLFNALAKLPNRRLSVVLVGSNENDCQKYLAPMASDCGVEVTFTGHVPAAQVNLLINESRMGVLCDKYDAVPRAMLEYMAADVPVLATADMRAGARYIGPDAGQTRTPEEFHEGIADILDNLDSFSPRRHLLNNYSRAQVVARFWKIVTELLAAETSPIT